jgi:hypothetical protein
MVYSIQATQQSEQLRRMDLPTQAAAVADRPKVEVIEAATVDLEL